MTDLSSDDFRITSMDVSSAATDRQVVAFYYPQFHEIELNNTHFGPGFNEWDMVKAARPLYRDHDQPVRPGSLGEYDLVTPGVFERQVDLARTHGVSGFCFYHYWFTGGKRLLERPLELVLQSDVDFPFCLMWANHDWTLNWSGKNDVVTQAMTYGEPDTADFISDSKSILNDTRYIRIDGKPLLLIYDLRQPPTLSGFVTGIRRAAIDLGIGDLYIAGVQTDTRPFDFQASGLDALCEFPPRGYARDELLSNTLPAGLDPLFSGKLFDYQRLIEASLRRENLVDGLPYFRAATPGWDNTARRQVALDPWIFTGATPSLFQGWLRELLHNRHDSNDLPLVFVNAWNEWGEGAYLEPDATWGLSRLEAVRSAVSRTDPDTAGSSEQIPPSRQTREAVLTIQQPHGVSGPVRADHDPPVSEPAQLRIERLGTVVAPFASKQFLARPGLLKIEGCLFASTLDYDREHRGHHVIALRSKTQDATFEFAAHSSSAFDLLEKHRERLTAQNLSLARFEAVLNLFEIPPDTYDLSVRYGTFGASHPTTVVVSPFAPKASDPEWAQLGFDPLAVVELPGSGADLLRRSAHRAGLRPIVWIDQPRVDVMHMETMPGLVIVPRPYDVDLQGSGATTVHLWAEDGIRHRRLYQLGAESALYGTTLREFCQSHSFDEFAKADDVFVASRRDATFGANVKRVVFIEPTLLAEPGPHRSASREPEAPRTQPRPAEPTATPPFDDASQIELSDPASWLG